MKRILRIGTRKSPLALAQTQIVIQALQKVLMKDTVTEIVPIVTKGDRLKNASLTKIGGKGVFVKEVEQALLTGEIDFAVHSLKDLPAVLPEKLTLGAIIKRANPFDCLILRQGKYLTDLPREAVIGTSSLRRQLQLKEYLPAANFQDLRGNVETRIKKMEERKLDGIVLAVAGLERLNWFSNQRYASIILSDHCVPAVGQGALAVECRKDDQEILSLLREIHHKETDQCITAERALLKTLNGNCDIPVGAYGYFKEGQLFLKGYLGDVDTQKNYRATASGNPENAEALGEKVGYQLLNQVKRKQ